MFRPGAAEDEAGNRCAGGAPERDARRDVDEARGARGADGDRGAGGIAHAREAAGAAGIVGREGRERDPVVRRHRRGGKIRRVAARAGHGRSGRKRGPGRGIGGGFDLVGRAFDGGPRDRDRAADLRGADGDRRRLAGADEFRDGLVDRVHGSARRRAEKRPPDHIGIFRRAVRFDREEVGPGAGGKLGRHTEADVVFVEIKIGAVGFAEIAEVVVVFDEVAEGIGRVHRRTGNRGGQRGTAVLRAGGPGRQRRAAGGGEVRGAARAVALHVTGRHAPQAALRIHRRRVTVGPVHRQPVLQPRDNRRVGCDRSGALGIKLGRRIELDVVAQLVADGGGVRVIVVVGHRLMRERRVKGLPFVVKRFAVPHAVPAQPVHRRGVGVAPGRIRKRIAVVEGRDAVDEVADGAETGEGLGRRNRRRAREPVEHARVGRIAGERLRVRGVAIPRPHHVRAKTGRAQIDPTRRRGHLDYARVARGRLRRGAARPRGHGGAGEARGVAYIDARIAARAGRLPGFELRIGGTRGQGRGEAGEEKTDGVIHGAHETTGR